MAPKALKASFKTFGGQNALVGVNIVFFKRKSSLR